MKNNKILTLFMAALLFIMSFWAWFKKEDEFSDSERRYLANFPKLTAGTVSSGKFMDEFETYSQDQFPLRDSFRSLKANFALKVLKHKDNNGVYSYEGHIAQQNYPMNEKMLDNAAQRLRFIYDSYLAESECQVYFSIIPEKGAFTDGLELNFDELEGYMLEKTDFARYIDIKSSLELEDYYHTDSHWKQEKILDVAETILKNMKADRGTYELEKTDVEFYGVYSGMLAMNTEPDSLNYLTNDTIKNCIVTSYDTGEAETIPFYDMAAAEGRDPYEMFLGGADALVVIENPHAESDRELVIFRDSFGSSLAPLLLEAYSKVTLVDIRYMQSTMVGNFIDFDKQDVLFIYSTMLLNNSLALK